VQQVRVTLAAHEFTGNVRKPRKWGIQRIEPKCYAPRRTAFLPYSLPASGAQHFALVMISDDRAAFLADINGPFRSVGVFGDVVLAGPFQAAELQFDEFAAMRARNEVVLFNVGSLFRFPNVPRF